METIFASKKPALETETDTAPVVTPVPALSTTDAAVEQADSDGTATSGSAAASDATATDAGSITPKSDASANGESFFAQSKIELD